MARAAGVVLWLVVWLPSAAGAVDPTTGPSPPPTAIPAAPIPLPEIAKRADELAVYLQEVDRRIEPGDAVEEIDTELPAVAERITVLRNTNARVLPGRPALRAVDELSDQWESLQSTLAGWDDLISTRATQLEEEARGIAELQTVWRVTRDASPAAGAPPAVMERIRTALALLQAMRRQVDAQRQILLVLQDRVVQALAACRDGLAVIKEYRREAVGNLLVRDALPLWARERWSSVAPDALAKMREQLTASSALLSDYGSTQLPQLPLQLFIFVALLVLWRQARRHTVRWLADDDSLANVAAVFEHPISTALLLALLSSFWIYPQGPVLLRTLARIAAVPLLLRVVDRMVDRPFLPGLYVLGMFFIVDQLRILLAPLPALEQILFILETVAGIIAPLWMLRSGRLGRLTGGRAPRTVAAIERGALVLAVLFAFAALAAVLGFMQLARVVTAAILGAGYAAMLLFVVQRLAAGLWAYALRTTLLRRLLSVRRHGVLLQRRGEWALAWAALVLWVVAALRGAELFDPTVDTLRAVLGAHLTVGSFSVSLGNLLAFGVTIWMSFLLSRFARFVLDEDVYPRLQLARGLPYAFSSILHYTVLLVGFLIALAATGLNLDRFTILAGAFGVGVGFGMQNIVNNFVSGLILLFERPIKVGDVVQIGQLQGEVRRIGIRASTVRTGEGAEVIVPNAHLIADPVTNWTFSDRMRRIDLSIGVPYGSDPERVLDLLRGVAGANPRILEDPAPVALLMTFGPATIEFQLRAWTDRFEDWLLIRSELSIAANRTLTDAGILTRAKPGKEESPAPTPAEQKQDE